MSAGEPIAITGIGLCSAAGDTAEALWHAVQGEDRCPTLWQPPEVEPPPPRELFLRRVATPLRLPQPPVIRRQHRADRVIHLALAAAGAAWRDAGLAESQEAAAAREEIAIVAGTSRGLVHKWSEARVGEAHAADLRPTWAGESSLAALHGALGAFLDATGPALTVSTACSSGGHALALAAGLLTSGQARWVVAGGADAPLHPYLLRHMFATGILDPLTSSEATERGLLPCRPFSSDAQGTLLGEGAAFVVMERLTSAQARAARVQGLLLGCGMAGDGRSASAESAGANALEFSVHRALRQAGIEPEAIAYVNTHGTGTVVNDSLESQWLEDFHLHRQQPVAYSSTKPATGHCLGATPVMEAILCWEALRRGELPRTPHTRVPAPYAPAGLVLERGQPMPPGYALSVSLGFWGASCALVLGAA